MPGLDDEVKWVRGVGPRVAELLAAKGIHTAEDLLYHLPFRYEDRQNPRSLDELKPGEMASVIAEVRGAALLRTRTMPLFEMTLGQGRLAMKCLWFHGTYLKDSFTRGRRWPSSGKVEPSRSSPNFKMIQPQFEILPDASEDAETRMLEVGRITPVYESLGGSRLASRWQRKVIFHTCWRACAGRFRSPCRRRCGSGWSCRGARGRCAEAHFPRKARRWRSCRRGRRRRIGG